MSVIQICVGSSCHIKGSYRVIQTYKKLIEKYTNGIAATFDGEPVENLSIQNCEAIFMEKVMR